MDSVDNVCSLDSQIIGLLGTFRISQLSCDYLKFHIVLKILSRWMVHYELENSTLYIEQ